MRTAIVGSLFQGGFESQKAPVLNFKMQTNDLNNPKRKFPAVRTFFGQPIQSKSRIIDAEMRAAELGAVLFPRRTDFVR